jgi:hypothetical protein
MMRERRGRREAAQFAIPLNDLFRQRIAEAVRPCPKVARKLTLRPGSSATLHRGGEPWKIALANVRYQNRSVRVPKGHFGGPPPRFDTIAVSLDRHGRREVNETGAEGPSLRECQSNAFEPGGLARIHQVSGVAFRHSEAAELPEGIRARFVGPG